MKSRPHSSPAKRSGIQPPARPTKRSEAARVHALLAGFQRDLDTKVAAVRSQSDALMAACAAQQETTADFIRSMIEAMERCALLTDSPAARADIETIIAQSRAVLPPTRG